MASAASVAVISDVKDPMDLGRVQVRLSAQAGGALEWARVVSAPVGPTRTALQLDIGDEVLVVFDQANVRQPIVIGNLWNGADSPPTGATAVHLPTGSILHPIVESAETSVDCSMTADLQRQIAPWLASIECLLRILALLKPLIDVVEHLPTPSPSALQEFVKAAVDLQPCLLMSTTASALPLVHDLLCLSLRSLECLSDRAAPPSELARAAEGIQGVLDLGRPFFAVAGLAPIRLSVLADPSALSSDIQALRSAVDALGGCGQ
jgi:hypothetical protein